MEPIATYTVPVKIHPLSGCMLAVPLLVIATLIGVVAPTTMQVKYAFLSTLLFFIPAYVMIWAIIEIARYIFKMDYKPKLEKYRELVSPTILFGFRNRKEETHPLLRREDGSLRWEDSLEQGHRGLQTEGQ